MNIDKGKELINLAKKSIQDFFENKETTTKKFPEKQGVFVTIKTLNNKLRGCIGYPLPTNPLGEATIKSARFAAFKDSRFQPLQKTELDKILIEISVLTKPKLIKANTKQELLDKIKLGTHGLLIKCEGFEGLLLPQVPLEHKWTKEDFLQNLCLKAGLIPEHWESLNCEIYSFKAEIFSETKNKKIVKLK